MSLIREGEAVVVCLLGMLVGDSPFYYMNCFGGFCWSGVCFYGLGKCGIYVEYVMKNVVCEKIRLFMN